MLRTCTECKAPAYVFSFWGQPIGYGYGYGYGDGYGDGTISTSTRRR